MSDLTVRGHLQAALAGFPDETQGWEQPILNHLQAALELVPEYVLTPGMQVVPVRFSDEMVDAMLDESVGYRVGRMTWKLVHAGDGSFEWNLATSVRVGSAY